MRVARIWLGRLETEYTVWNEGGRKCCQGLLRYTRRGRGIGPVALAGLATRREWSRGKVVESGPVQTEEGEPGRSGEVRNGGRS